jgi:hypothetical protein
LESLQEPEISWQVSNNLFNQGQQSFQEALSAFLVDGCPTKDSHGPQRLATVQTSQAMIRKLCITPKFSNDQAFRQSVWSQTPQPETLQPIRRRVNLP